MGVTLTKIMFSYILPQTFSIFNLCVAQLLLASLCQTVGSQKCTYVAVLCSAYTSNRYMDLKVFIPLLGPIFAMVSQGWNSTINCSNT